MTKSAKALAKLRESPTNVRYDELYAVCVEFFGLPRQRGTSHAVFKTPWPADPRVNIQRSDNGGVKIYQLKQVVAAIDKLQQMEPEEGA